MCLPEAALPIGKTRVCLPNNGTVLAASIDARGPAARFFTWITPPRRITPCVGPSDNAVKSQIRIAVSVYVLIAIVKKCLNLDALLYTLLQIVSVTFFEKMRLEQTFAGGEHKAE